MLFNSKNILTILLVLCLSHQINPLHIQINSGPTIGIISTPDPDNSHRSQIKATNHEYLLAGGPVNVIPIPWDIESSKLNRILESLNGLFLIGGEANLWEEDSEGHRRFSAFQKRMNYIVNYVLQKNKDGVYYPLWAICEGFEAASIALTKDVHLLDNYEQEGEYKKLYFTPQAKKSILFQYFSEDDFKFLEENPAMYYKHNYGLNTSVPTLHPSLSSNEWIVTATGKDENGKAVLSAMESLYYPFYMHLFHPERALHDALYESVFSNASHVISTATKLSRSFLTEASKNRNKFSNDDLLRALLIENLKKEDGFYILTKNSLDEEWLSAYEGVINNFILGCGLFLVLSAISGLMWVFLHRKGKDLQKVHYERIQTVSI